MKYLIVWAKDSDYSPFYVNPEGDPQGPRLFATLEEVKDVMENIAYHNPGVEAYVFVVSDILKVKATTTIPVIDFLKEENEQ